MTDQPSSSTQHEDHEGYILDAENAAEMARLMLQDHMLTQALGGLIPELPDLSKVHQVLDIGCGPGGWLLELATQYPHLQGTGIDISQLMVPYATNMAASQGISNVRFLVMDATQKLDFPDETFDLVNARILTGFLSTKQWASVLSECYRITRPGGIVRLTEAEWGFTNSHALDKLTGHVTHAMHMGGHTFSPHGRTFGTTPVLRLLLLQAGYESVDQRAYALDFSNGSPWHDSNIQNHLVFHKQVQPFIAYMQVATQEELSQLYEQMEADFQSEIFCGIDYYLAVWARKPA